MLWCGMSRPGQLCCQVQWLLGLGDIMEQHHSWHHPPQQKQQKTTILPWGSCTPQLHLRYTTGPGPSIKLIEMISLGSRLAGGLLVYLHPTHLHGFPFSHFLWKRSELLARLHHFLLLSFSSFAHPPLQTQGEADADIPQVKGKGQHFACLLKHQEVLGQWGMP